MKAIIFGILALFAVDAQADVSVRAYSTIPTDSEQIVQNGYGVQANYHMGALYLYLSGDKNPVRFGGQGGQDVLLGSAGVGFQHKVGPIRLVGDVGWYEPFHNSDRDKFATTTLTEGLHYYMVTKLGMKPNYPTLGLNGYFDWYSIDYNGAIGAKLGLEYSHVFTSGWSLNIGAYQRFLRLGEMVKGGNDDGTMWWEYKENRDFGTTQVSMRVEVPF